MRIMKNSNITWLLRWKPPQINNNIVKKVLILIEKWGEFHWRVQDQEILKTNNNNGFVGMYLSVEIARGYNNSTYIGFIDAEMEKVIKLARCSWRWS